MTAPHVPGAFARPLRNRSRAAAILCYHSIHPEGPAWTSIPPELFERQLATLVRQGYGRAGKREIESLASGARPPRALAVLTFDDGYRDNHELALPLLQAYGLAGAFFVLPPLVDGGGRLDWAEIEDRARTHPDVMRSLDWSQVGELAEAGCEIGSHGLRHRHMTRLSDHDLREELWESRRQIKERLGRCDTLAYPFGDWSPRVAAAARDAGYSLAFTLPRDHQRDVTCWSVPRIAIDHRDGGRRFALKLRPLARSLYLSRAKARLRGS